ncbi:glycosyl hydrolase [Actinobacteria bacterium YIM 96077]|uniref:Glycosyl hydrolase n=1 Tax=Phytoactinopolyspora halophila TaxID=1981511 RepID=A0A329QI61_9ACTN|nr:glycosyl hydrolase [Actinobacteria bacterium YIM 96077]RAW12053.1 glycosyl hydrolase [Phytoactinopolyspora halophila]
MHDHIEHLLSQLDLEQKVRLVSGSGLWRTCGEAQIGLRPIVLSDGPSGVRGERPFDERDPSVCLPCPSALAATWDEDLMARLTELVATEALRKGARAVLGPTINIHRSPLSGRHFECFSEDPLLTARMAVVYVRTLQSFGISSAPKHYVANDSETDRFTVDVQVDECTLRELYLKPFEYVVSAGAWMLMAAYNSVNGYTMTESPLLSDPLKGEWGFDGVVVSDWTAVRSTETAGRAGTDLAMPGPSAEWGQPLVTAVKEERVPEAAIDDKVRRILRLACRVGAVEGVERAVLAFPNVADSGGLLREAAASSMVLIHNPDELLPLDANDLRRIAVIGPNAERSQIQGGGSAGVTPTYSISALEGIRAAVGQCVEVAHHKGVDVGGTLRPAPTEAFVNLHTGEHGFQVQFLDASGTVVDVENRRATTLIWTLAELSDVKTIEARARFRAPGNGKHTLGVAGRGHYVVEASGEVLIDDFAKPRDDFAAEAPTYLDGELMLNQDQQVDITVKYEVPTTGQIAEIIIALKEPTWPDDESIASSARLAQMADAAIVVVGTTASDESEGADRTTLSLPGRQDDLVYAVAAANPRTVVVVNSGAPILMPWHLDVASVLISWFPGQEFGNALADVLFGAREPNGRLPTTWWNYQDESILPQTCPQDGRLNYTEGIHIGYRTPITVREQPAYPFGHGLGYTTWEYLSIETAEKLDIGQATWVHIQVSNTGRRTGREVVQVYLQRTDSAYQRPRIWLAGFAPVVAQPGEMVEVAVELEARVFEHWSPMSRRWEIEPGTFTVLGGRSAVDLRLHTEITFDSKVVP